MGRYLCNNNQFRGFHPLELIHSKPIHYLTISYELISIQFQYSTYKTYFYSDPNSAPHNPKPNTSEILPFGTQQHLHLLSAIDLFRLHAHQAPGANCRDDGV